MSEDIVRRIKEKLTEIEETEGVRILHCVESGSRAWGFASPDSDYDVRFIYVRPKDWYLKLEKTRDVIEWQLDDVYDISGWDLQKALRLLYKSNPTLFEWNSSPIVYRTVEGWEKVRSVINDYFLSKHGIYHYLSTARHNYKEYLRTDEVKLKKYFYVLRPLLACRWIRDKHTPPPMLFSELIEAELEESIRPYVEELLDKKMQSPEIGTGKRIDELNKWIEKDISEMKKLVESMDDNMERDWEPLNELFLSLIE